MGIAVAPMEPLLRIGSIPWLSPRGDSSTGALTAQRQLFFPLTTTKTPVSSIKVFTGSYSLRGRKNGFLRSSRTHDLRSARFMILPLWTGLSVHSSFSGTHPGVWPAPSKAKGAGVESVRGVSALGLNLGTTRRRFFYEKPPVNYFKPLI